MFYRYIKICCEFKDNINVQKIVEEYVNRRVIYIQMSNEVITLSFKLNRFKINKLKHDLETLSIIGIKTQCVISTRNSHLLL